MKSLRGGGLPDPADVGRADVVENRDDVIPSVGIFPARIESGTRPRPRGIIRLRCKTDQHRIAEIAHLVCKADEKIIELAIEHGCENVMVALRRFPSQVWKICHRRLPSEQRHRAALPGCAHQFAREGDFFLRSPRLRERKEPEVCAEFARPRLECRRKFAACRIGKSRADVEPSGVLETGHVCVRGHKSAGSQTDRDGRHDNREGDDGRVFAHHRKRAGVESEAQFFQWRKEHPDPIAAREKIRDALERALLAERGHESELRGIPQGECGHHPTERRPVAMQSVADRAHAGGGGDQIWRSESPRIMGVVIFRCRDVRQLDPANRTQRAAQKNPPAARAKNAAHEVRAAVAFLDGPVLRPLPDDSRDDHDGQKCREVFDQINPQRDAAEDEADDGDEDIDRAEKAAQEIERRDEVVHLLPRGHAAEKFRIFPEQQFDGAARPFHLLLAVRRERRGHEAAREDFRDVHRAPAARIEAHRRVHVLG